MDECVETDLTLGQSVSKAVKNAFDQPGLKLPNQTDSDSITKIVSVVIAALQPIIMEAVPTAIANTSETIVNSIKQDLDSLKAEREDIGKVNYYKFCYFLFSVGYKKTKRRRTITSLH